MKLSEKLIKIITGISDKVGLDIEYHEKTRNVECHVLGYNFKDELIIRVFEKSRNKESVNRFKLYKVSEIENIKVTNNKFNKRILLENDKAMSKIVLSTFEKE